MNVLDDIRKLVENGSLSFVVGAGFSKNVSEVFPLWGELLEPLVIELYPECEEGNKEERIGKIVAEKGYLSIASEYVRRKGYHEAIDVYIEKKIPFLRRKGENYEVCIGNNVVDTKPSLVCHKKLLALGVKHIFTFNYDNALDILADVDETERLL